MSAPRGRARPLGRRRGGGPLAAATAWRLRAVARLLAAGLGAGGVAAAATSWGHGIRAGVGAPQHLDRLHAARHRAHQRRRPRHDRRRHMARPAHVPPRAVWHAPVLSQQTLWNPVFHAGATVAYREYSPGLVTALALFPATWVALTGAAIRERRISRRGAALSALAGAAVHAAAVAQQVYGVDAEP